MAVRKTEFVDGTWLSYPISVYPQLFAVLDTRTQRKFFEKVNQLDGKNGEGMDPEQIVNMFRVGLVSSIQDITFKQAEEYVTKFVFEYGFDALIIKLVDAFADSGLLSRKQVQKNRERAEKNKELREELEKIRDKRNEAILKKCWVDAENLDAKAQQVLDDLDKARDEAEKEDAKTIEALKKAEEVEDGPLDPDMKETE